MSDSNTAWLLDVGNDIRIAVAEPEMVEYMLAPRLHRLPLTPHYCSHVLLWRRLILPVIELTVLFDRSPSAGRAAALTVLRYQKVAHTPLEYFGLLVEKPPHRIIVNDQQACDGPTSDHKIWQTSDLVLAYFSHNEMSTPMRFDTLSPGSLSVARRPWINSLIQFQAYFAYLEIFFGQAAFLMTEINDGSTRMPSTMMVK